MHDATHASLLFPQRRINDATAHRARAGMTRTIASWSALAPVERVARCRALGALLRVYCGPCAAPLVELLRRAERDPAHLPAADAALHELPTIPMRRALASLLQTLPSRKRTDLMTTIITLADHKPRCPGDA